ATDPSTKSSGTACRARPSRALPRRASEPPRSRLAPQDPWLRRRYACGVRAASPSARQPGGFRRRTILPVVSILPALGLVEDAFSDELRYFRVLHPENRAADFARVLPQRWSRCNDRLGNRGRMKGRPLEHHRANAGLI